VKSLPLVQLRPPWLQLPRGVLLLWSIARWPQRATRTKGALPLPTMPNRGPPRQLLRQPRRMRPPNRMSRMKSSRPRRLAKMVVMVAEVGLRVLLRRRRPPRPQARAQTLRARVAAISSAELTLPRWLLALLKYTFYPLFILDNGMNLISKSLTVLTPA